MDIIDKLIDLGVYITVAIFCLSMAGLVIGTGEMLIRAGRRWRARRNRSHPINYRRTT